VVPEPDPEPEPEPDPEPEPEPEEPTYPDFEQPTGDHDAYSTGDRVLFEGQVYESLVDNNVWSPRDYPQGWRMVEETPGRASRKGGGTVQPEARRSRLSV